MFEHSTATWMFNFSHNVHPCTSWWAARTTLLMTGAARSWRRRSTWERKSIFDEKLRGVYARIRCTEGRPRTGSCWRSARSGRSRPSGTRPRRTRAPAQNNQLLETSGKWFLDILDVQGGHKDLLSLYGKCSTFFKTLWEFEGSHFELKSTLDRYFTKFDNLVTLNSSWTISWKKF